MNGTSAARLCGVVALAALVGCHDTGAVRDNRGPSVYPVVPAGRVRSPALTPGSTVVVAVAPDLVVTFADSQEIVWKIQLPREESLVAAPGVAANSTTYLLTNKNLRLIDAAGETRFVRAVPFDRRGSDPSRWGLVVLPDSSVVVSDGRHRACRLDRLGAITWRYALPAGAGMVARPVAGPNGSVYLRTASSLHAVGGDGRLRWRVSLRGF